MPGRVLGEPPTAHWRTRSRPRCPRRPQAVQTAQAPNRSGWIQTEYHRAMCRAGSIRWPVQLGPHLPGLPSPAPSPVRRTTAGSPRTFLRRFHEVTDTTPRQWILRQRLLYAQHLLESSDERVERVADLCGFGSAATLRLHFQRSIGVTPLMYRRTFRSVEVNGLF